MPTHNTFTNYLEERLDELRKRYRDTGEARWLHRYNEAQHLREHLMVERISREQAARQGEGRETYSPTPYPASTNSNG